MWANAWDVFPRIPSGVGRCRRAAVDFVVFFWVGRIFFPFFSFRFYFVFEGTRPAGSMRLPCLIYLSTSTRVRTGCHYLICRSVCVCVCVTFVVFTDCESCARPISTNPISMEAGEYGLTRGTCSIACHLELHAVAGLLWISWCILCGADFSVFFFFSIFSSSNAHGLL